MIIYEWRYPLLEGVVVPPSLCLIADIDVL